MPITVKFVGALRRVANRSSIIIDCSNFSVKDLIQKILLTIPEIKNDIINQQVDGTIKNTVLILVNEREISVLKGLDTLLNDKDAVVFIPVAHGG